MADAAVEGGDETPGNDGSSVAADAFDVGPETAFDVPFDQAWEVGFDGDGPIGSEAPAEDAEMDAMGLRDAADATPLPRIVEYLVPTPGSYPDGIVRADDGSIWFTEQSGNKIGRLTADGLIREFSLPTSGSSPNLIAASKTGDFWFTELFGHRIGRITPTGQISEFDVAPDQPNGIALGADGLVWFTSETKVSKLSPETGQIVDFGSFTALGPIVAAPDGSFWFSDMTASNIIRVSSNGALQSFVAGVSTSHPVGLVLDGDSLWFAEYYGNRIGRMAIAEGGAQPMGTVREYPIPTRNSLPVGVALDRDGNVWFTENAAGAIGRLSPAGVVDEFPLPLANSRPVHIISAPDGTLWFTENAANRIGHVVR